jgi:SAM-dependent methyltransferase
MALPRSRLLVPAVLRPFGEHLADIVRPQPGEVCVAVGWDGGVMPALLSRSGARCIAVDDGTDVLPLPDGAAQVVTSLFTLTDAPDPVAALREMLRILDPRRGRLAVAVWSEPAAVPHLDALTPAAPGVVEAATRLGYPLVAERIVEQAGAAERVAISRIHDVVRFDGIAHWWAALSNDPNEHVPPDASTRLQQFATYDGTLRIPTEAVLLTIPAHETR